MNTEYLYPAELGGFVPGYPKPLEDRSRMVSIRALIDNDPEVQELRISVITKSDAPQKLDSFMIERAVLKWASNHIPTWVEYIRKNSMTTL